MTAFPKTASTVAMLVVAPFVGTLVVLAAASALLSGNLPLLDALFRNRPSYADVPLTVHVQAQLLGLQLVNDATADLAKTVPVIGSSSVVNGVDVGVMTDVLRRDGLRAVNFGLTGLSAYELPLLRSYLLARGRSRV